MPGQQPTQHPDRAGRHDGRGRNPEHHHRGLEHGRRCDEAGVDVHAGVQAGIRCDAQVGEQARHLWALVETESAGGAGDADEVRADRADIGPDTQFTARAGIDGSAWRDGGDGVAERDVDDVGVGVDEQAVAPGIDTVRRDGGEHQAALGGQAGHRPARDGHGQ